MKELLETVKGLMDKPEDTKPKEMMDKPEDTRPKESMQKKSSDYEKLIKCTHDLLLKQKEGKQTNKVS